MTIIPYKEVNFKSNSILQNRLVRWGLYSLLYCKLVLSLVYMDFQHNFVLNQFWREKLTNLCWNCNCQLRRNVLRIKDGFQHGQDWARKHRCKKNIPYCEPQNFSRCTHFYITVRDVSLNGGKESHGWRHHFQKQLKNKTGEVSCHYLTEKFSESRFTKGSVTLH